MKRMFFLLVAAALAVFLYVGFSFWSAARKVYEPPDSPRSEKRTEDISMGNDPAIILLLGVDKRKGDVGRADSIALAAVNPDRKSAALVNIPRDLLVRIPGRSRLDKINHTYAYGGTGLTRRTVEELLDLPVDGVMRIDMDGLNRIVDALGSVEVDVPFDFTYEGIRFRRGTMFLHGQEALAFVRMRKEDPRGDYGRISRQQAVVLGILRRATEWSSITRLDDVMDEAGNHLKTDIPPLAWIRLHRNFSGMDPGNIRTDSVRGKTVKLNGIYYLAASDRELRRVRNLLAEEIGWQGNFSGDTRTVGGSGTGHHLP